MTGPVKYSTSTPKRQPCWSPPSNPVGSPLFRAPAGTPSARRWARSLGVVVLFALMGFAPQTLQAQVTPGPESATGLQFAVAVEQALVDAIARSERSVVAIASLRSDPNTNTLRDEAFRPDPFDRFRQEVRATQPNDPDFVPSEYGTGVVIDRRGLILTQYHVLEDADQHWVTTAERKTYPATVRAADPRSGLAILQIEATDLEPIRFGDAATLRKGQIVIALGNPYAIAQDGQVSASWGIVSNLARKAGQVPSTDRNAQKPSLHHFGTLIQTDAKLNLGTSGGALINLRGEMVGLTTSVAATAGYEMAAGYAVPIDETFLRVIEVLKQGREVEYGLLGVEPENLLPSEVRQGRVGLRVRDVWAGTPADRVGLQTGDIITHVNDLPVHDADSLVLYVGRLPAATTVQLTYERDAKLQKVAVELAKYPVRGKKVVTTRPDPWRGISVDYPTALPAEEYRDHTRAGTIDLDGCVAITEVEPDSPAWAAGLRAGPRMFITHVGSRRIHNPQDFFAATAGQTGPVRVRLNLPDDQQPVRMIEPPK